MHVKGVVPSSPGSLLRPFFQLVSFLYKRKMWGKKRKKKRKDRASLLLVVKNNERLKKGFAVSSFAASCIPNTTGRITYKIFVFSVQYVTFFGFF